MELDKVILKIAENQRLSPEEKRDLGLELRNTQARNALVSKWADSDFTKEDFYNQQLRFKLVGAKLSRSGNVSIADSTLTPFQWNTIDYADIGMVNLTADNTKITATRNGRYSVGVNVAMNAIASG